MDSWSVRRANDNDVRSLVQLRQQSRAEQIGQILDHGFEHDWLEWYSREREHRVFWMAETGDLAIGATNLMIFDRMPRPGGEARRWGYLANMYVVAEHRDLGVGGDLLGAVLDHARRERLVRVVLSPSPRSKPFYERAGFAPASDLFVLTLDDPERGPE